MTHPQENSFIPHPSSLVPSLVAFGRLLRSLGLPVKTEQMTTLATALAQIDMARRADFKATCCAVLINRHEHLPLFHLAFDAFWQSAPPNGRQPINLGEILRKVRRQVGYHAAALADGTGEVDETVQDRSFAYSYAATLRFKDFAELDREELSQVRQEMNKIAWELPPRRTRRKQPFHGREHIDLRRTLHHNLRHGGELVRLVYRSRKLSPRPIVALCDISGSMERYSRILLQFLYIVANRRVQQRAHANAARVESFVFSTRLTRITHHLARRDIDDALRQATHAVHDWGSGTRIGESIREFNYRWTRRVLNRGAVVLIISDGWDRGDIDLLHHEMARLRRSCSRIVWLNPLLGNADYQPLVRGIRAALPFVDDFLPVHNLASLEQLSRTLKEHGGS